MKLFKFLNKIFFKKTSDNNKITRDLTDNIENYKGLDLDKIEILLKKYNCEDEEELVIALKEREFYYEEFTEDEKIFYNNPEYDFLKNLADLSFTLHREHLDGRSLAIRELIENRYQILLDEHGNPFKELINFTLKYFDRYFVEKPTEAKELLIDTFPIMHLYIIRQIFKQQNEITFNNLLDEQNAFDEFLFFFKTKICSLYPDKSTRDQQIKHHFKIIHNDLIQFVDTEKTN